ncbi:hypothetical protein ACFWPQ_28655 [Streptomyces sp. NPDC058464]|uniref:hypothetical protein n=1 Tax=Streptomyces sp. NPDC058464 TaxID=3346511 RepID=UPI00366172C4
MSDAVHIARMRLHRPRHGPPDAYAAVRALGLAPPVPDRSVLVIRRLSVPAAQPRTVRDRVAALRRSAARPALGPTPPDCTAVVFSDEVEAMTCLTADLVMGRAADRWYWPAEVRRGVRSAGTGTTLARLWLERPAWVPAALAQLARRSPGFPGAAGDAVRAIDLLSDAQAQAVIDAVLTAFHMPQARTGPAGAPVGAAAEAAGGRVGGGATGAGAVSGGTASASDRPLHPVPDRLPTPAPDDLPAPAPHRLSAPAPDRLAGPTPVRLSGPAPDRTLAPAPFLPQPGTALRPAGRALLALGLTLAATPWAARDDRLAGEIDAQLRTADPAAPNPAGPSAHATPRRAGAGSTSPGVPQRADEPVDFGYTVSDHRPPSSHPPRLRPPAVAVRRPDSVGTPHPPDATGIPTPAPQLAESRIRVGSPAAGEVVETRFATLFYAVNLMTWLDLPRTDDAHEPVSGWATLEALGAWLLPDASAIGPGSGHRDPIWRILAELDGRDALTPTPVRLDGVTGRLRDLLARHRLTPEVFARPGTLLIGRTHVDVILGLHQIDLTARSSGLDQDPGWVPALGRIIAFHYDGFDHDGFDHDGFDHDGHDHDGFDHDRFDHDGHDGGN